MTALNTAKKFSSASKSVTYSVSTPASGVAAFSINIGPTPAAAAGPSKDVEKAVYGYVRAVRALGRTEINVSDISRALNLSESAVVQALGALRSKGIKFV
jgi:hypothetical protein